MIFRTNVLDLFVVLASVTSAVERRPQIAVTEPLEVVVRPLFGKNSCRSLPVAVTEPLEVAVGPQFGKNSYRNLPVAVTEPLEVAVRPLFGKNSCHSLPVAVTEPLEVVVRALFGQKSSEKLTPNQRRSQIDINRQKKAVTQHTVHVTAHCK